MPTHAEKRIVPYSADQMYDLIADIGSYPEFLPWCAGGAGPQPRAAAGRDGRGDRGRPRHLVQGVSRAVRQPGDLAPRGARDRRRVSRRPVQVPAQPLEVRRRAGRDACEVDFFVDFEFRSTILQRLIGLVFNEAMQRIVRAFERRAEALYGSRRVERLKHEVERGLDAALAHDGAPERAEVAALGASTPCGRGDGEPDQALGLGVRAAGAGDAGDRDGELDVGARRARLRPWRGRPARRPRRVRRASPRARRASRSWPGRSR